MNNIQPYNPAHHSVTAVVEAISLESYTKNGWQVLASFETDVLEYSYEDREVDRANHNAYGTEQKTVRVKESFSVQQKMRVTKFLIGRSEESVLKEKTDKIEKLSAEVIALKKEVEDLKKQNEELSKKGSGSAEALLRLEKNNSDLSKTLSDMRTQLKHNEAMLESAKRYVGAGKWDEVIDGQDGA